jgi:hypothetical protein
MLQPRSGHCRARSKVQGRRIKLRFYFAAGNRKKPIQFPVDFFNHHHEPRSQHLAVFRAGESEYL